MNSSEVTLRKLERDAQADRLALTLPRPLQGTQPGKRCGLQRPDHRSFHAQIPVDPERPTEGLLLAICGVVSFIVGALAVHLIGERHRSSSQRLKSGEPGVAGRHDTRVAALGCRLRRPPASAQPTVKRSRPVYSRISGLASRPSSDSGHLIVPEKQDEPRLELGRAPAQAGTGSY